MSKYPALTEMGVQNPEQIARFAFYTVDETDILHIVYDRKKGSILPVSRKYKFPRVKKSTMVDSGSRTFEYLYESSGAFMSALAELNQLMEKRESKQDMRALITEEVRALEEDVAVRMDYIKSLIKEL